MNKRNIQTPWGQSDFVEDIGDGILRISTPSHGGYYVPHEMLEKMPKPALKTFAGLGWYEEDCDWALVALSFPQLFPAEALEDAKRTVSGWGTVEQCQAFALISARK